MCLYRISKPCHHSVCVSAQCFESAASYWSGLSVTNEPSGTVTGIRANSIMCLVVWVCECVRACVGGAWVARRSVCACLCVFVCVSGILCGQWGRGGCKTAIAPASVVLQLIYWTARQRGGAGGCVCERGGGSGGQGEASSSQGSQPSNLKYTPWLYVLLLPHPKVTWSQSFCF